jgi:hypothetical protein
VIKASGMANGRPLVLIGLSGENMARLMSDEPIRFDLAELGLPPTVVLIVGGRTEDDIAANLREVGLLAPAGGSDG